MINTTILIDNISNRSDLVSEWGLAMLIEYEGMKILLDTGVNQYKWLSDELGKYGVRSELMECGLKVSID